MEKFKRRAMARKLEHGKRKYAQYENSILICYVQKGKRKIRGLRFNGKENFIIWKGFVNPNVDIFSNGPVSDLSFSSSHLEKALNSVEQKPLIKKLDN